MKQLIGIGVAWLLFDAGHPVLGVVLVVAAIVSFVLRMIDHTDV